MCSTHYERWRSAGGQVKAFAPRGKSQAFLERAIAYEGDECLLWPYGRHSQGYGLVVKGGKQYRVHTLVCEARHGPSPSSVHEVAHGCGNGHLGCVTPRHLRWATRAENVDDKVRHGRASRGLTKEQALAIYARAVGGERYADIAASFGVHWRTVAGIKRGETWGWVTGAVP